MRTTLLLLILLLPLRLFAAAGDIVGVSIETNGWQALVYVAGLGTNGTYDFGMRSNNLAISQAKLRINLTSQGFDDSGSATTISRTVYGVKQVRKPYPNDGSNDEVYSSGTNTLRIALSDYVFSGDSNVTATISTQLYTVSGVSNASATSVTVTNNSTATYQPVVAAWSWPGYQLFTNSSFTLRCVAWNRHSQGGRSVRLVKFIASDTHSHNVTSIVTTSTIDRTIGDAATVVEYVGTIDASTLTTLDTITTRFIAYPWVGTTNELWDTSTKSGTQPTPYSVNQAHVLDKSDTYGITIAVVSTNGNNTTGKAVTKTYWATNSSPAEFATIHGAANAIAGTNNTLYSRNNVGGGIIYLRPGSHQWTGGTVSAGGTPGTWVTVTAYPGSTRADVKLVGKTGDPDITDRVRVTGVRIEESASLMFYNMGAGWFDNNEINASGSAPWDDVSNFWFTRNTIEAMAQGLRSYGAHNAAFCLVRGNTINGLGTDSGDCYCTIGNVYTITPALRVAADYRSGQAAPENNDPIFAYNRVMSFDSSTPALDLSNQTNINGAAIVQNLFECISGSYSAISLAEYSRLGWKNVMYWHNTLVGQRINYAYNETGTNSIPIEYWSVAGNYFDDAAIKSDTFSTANSNRVGNWPVLYMVGGIGNVSPHIYNIGPAGSFKHETIGLAGYQPGGTDTTTNTWPGFVNPKSQNGITTNTGNGTYRLKTSSPIHQFNSIMISHDMDGIPRGASDPAGAYVSGNPRKGPVM